MFKLRIILFTFALLSSGAKAEVVLITNHENDISSLTRTEISWIYKLRKLSWKNGKRIDVVNLNIGSPVRNTFFETYLERTSREMQRYYIRASLTGMSLPPIELKSEKDVIEHIKNNHYSIGYISKRAVNKEIKVLKTYTKETK